MWRTDRYYGYPCMSIVATDMVTAVDRFYAMPWVFHSTVKIDQIGLHVGATSGGNFRIGLYSDLNGLPDALLKDFTSRPANAGANFTSLGGTVQVAAGRYWLGVTTSAAINVKTGLGSAFFPWVPTGHTVSGNVLTQMAQCVYKDTVPAASPLPASFGTPSGIQEQYPRIGLHFATPT